MKIAAMSDLHGVLPDMEPCDICVIAGDIAPLRGQRNYAQTRAWFRKQFTDWVEEQPVRFFVFTPGNHDFALYEKWLKEDKEDWWPFNVICLVDESIELEGITIFGTPWITGLPNWAFNKSEGTALTNYFKSKIPDECDIIISHAAPAIGELGTVLQNGSFNYMSDYSSVSLANAYKDKKFKYAFNGHIHSGIHSNIKCNGHIFRNVSINDESYNVTYPVYYFDI